MPLVCFSSRVTKFHRHVRQQVQFYNISFFFATLNNYYDKIWWTVFISVFLFVCKIHEHIHHLCNFKQLCYLNGVRILFTNTTYSHIFTCTQSTLQFWEHSVCILCIWSICMKNGHHFSLELWCDVMHS